jgi:hypothetical protein
MLLIKNGETVVIYACVPLGTIEMTAELSGGRLNARVAIVKVDDSCDERHFTNA